MSDPQDDKLFEAVSEALRAGPGSGAWAEAQRALTAEGIPAGDERRRLLLARQRLDRGKGWRQVYPKAGFTRRVMHAVERAAADRQNGFAGGRVAGWLWACGLICLAVLLAGGVWWGIASNRSDPGRDAVSAAVMTVPLAAVDFGSTWPASTRIVGGLPLNFAAQAKALDGATSFGLGFSVADLGRDYAGAAVVYDKPLDIAAGVAVEADLVLSLPEVSAETAADGDWVVQLFVSSDLPTDPQRGTGGAEISVSVGKPVGSPSDLPAGHSAAAVTPLLMVSPGDGNLARLTAETRYTAGTVGLRLKVLGQHASVEVNGREVWAGKHSLTAATGHYAGVRLLGRGQVGRSGLVVQQMRILSLPQQ
jgi:hypothetical protein